LTKIIQVWFYSGQKRVFEGITEMAVINKSQLKMTDNTGRDILLNWNNINFIECQDLGEVNK
jgi:hypothetical protein